MMKTVYFLFLILMFVSCSVSSKQSGSSIDRLPEINSDFNNLSIKTRISINYPNFNNIIIADIRIAGNDSLTINIAAPFGIPVGKLFATNKYFIFYNMFENVVYEGQISSTAMQELMMMPLAFEDMIGIFRCHPYRSPDNYRLESRIAESSSYLFVNDSNKEGVEFILYSTIENAVTQYQRKLKDGSILINVSYGAYKYFGKLRYPEIIMIKFSEGSSDLSISNVETVGKFNESFRFSVPTGVQRIEINN